MNEDTDGTALLPPLFTQLRVGRRLVRVSSCDAISPATPATAAVHPSLPDDEIQIPHLQVMQEWWWEEGMNNGPPK